MDALTEGLGKAAPASFTMTSRDGGGLAGWRLWLAGVVALAAAVAAGALFVDVVTGYGASRERGALLEIAAATAAALDPDLVSALRGLPSDAGTPAFEELRGTLRRVRDSLPDSRFVYLLGRRGGDVVFLVEAEPEQSSDYSAPGDVYADASEELRAVYASGTPMVEGPIRDHWGTWVSGVAPVRAGGTGEVLAILGIDISAQRWEEGVARYRGMALAIAALVGAILVFAAIFVTLQHRSRAASAVARRIVESSPAILYRFATTPGHPGLFVSENIVRLGYQPQDFMARGAYEALIHPEDLDGAREAGRRLLEGRSEAESIQFRLRARDGSYRWIDARETPLRDAKGRVVALEGILIDVTDRRLAEERLRTSEGALAEAQAIAHVGSWSCDIGSGDAVWSRETYRIHGVDPDGFTPTRASTFSLAHPEDRARVEAAYAASIESGTSFDVEFRIVRPDGTIRQLRCTGHTIRDAAGRPARTVGIVQDITERKDAEAEVLFANTLLKTELETSPDGILVVDAEGRVISFNQRFADIWQMPVTTLAAGANTPVLAAASAKTRDPEAFAARVRALYADREAIAREEIELRDGRFIDRHTAPLRADGRYLGRVWFFRDITDRKLAEAQILRSARQDALTGLVNRVAFMQSVDLAMAQSRRSGRRFAVFYIDLDYFKDVNDTLGHPIGDRLLQSVAERLKAATRTTDTVARFGGDEFAVIAADLEGPDAAAVLAEGLLAVLANPFVIDGNEIRGGASIGIAVYAPDGTDADALLSQADVALYRAKEDGRGNYRFFTERMDAEVRNRVTLSNELREAIRTGQLFLLYQPQVRVETGQIVGVEALVRWRHPERGVLSPAAFVDVAESKGLIYALGQFVLSAACRQQKAWIDLGIAPDRMAVNLSAMQFKRPAEVERDVRAALAEAALPPSRLELELTETVLMEASRAPGGILLRLREAGVRLAIDDFGTGYSSLDYLRRFPADRIKIAQTFVASIDSDPHSATIVRATLSLARELGIAVIAEGVETPEQLALLRSWDCGEVQGYYFAPPLQADALEPLLRAGRIIGGAGTGASTAA